MSCQQEMKNMEQHGRRSKYMNHFAVIKNLRESQDTSIFKTFVAMQSTKLTTNNAMQVYKKHDHLAT
jgi:hypothetical protein